MKSLFPIRVLYGVSAAYDGLLGLAFLAAGPQLYAACKITPPNHWGYVQFAAGILVVFGYMFLRIAVSPVANRNLVPYGILLKICYIATVFGHQLSDGVAPLFTWFAEADTVFALCFLASLGPLRRAAAPPAKVS